MLRKLCLTTALLWRLLVLILRDILHQIVPAAKKDISNDVILITGGGRGIGRRLALHFAKCHPKHIILWGRTQETLAETARSVQDEGVNCAYMLCDVSAREQVYSLAKEVDAKFGHVTILINNAGVVFANSFLNSDPEQIETTLRTNTLAHFWTTKAFLPAMIEQKKGHVVAVGSVLGLIGLNGAADYCSSKFATDGFMDALRDELRSEELSDITVTTVYPYHVDNEMFAGATTRFPKLFPSISEDYLAQKIVDAVLSGRERMVVPKLFYLSALFYRIAPVPAIIAIMRFIGGHQVIENMKEHKS
ncbi:hypothetical protein BsWGS_26235 [Bradybaena similaris]